MTLCIVYVKYYIMYVRMYIIIYIEPAKTMILLFLSPITDDYVSGTIYTLLPTYQIGTMQNDVGHWILFITYYIINLVWLNGVCLETKSIRGYVYYLLLYIYIYVYR